MNLSLYKVLLAVAAVAFLAYPGRVVGQRGDLNIVTFDVRDAGTTPGTAGCGNGLLTSCFGTTPMANNNRGEIVGMYLTDSGVYFGFLRSPKGKVESFTAPGADTTEGDFNGTYPYSINSLGAVTGIYQGKDEVLHGFIREPNGAYVEVDDPDAGTGAFQGTWPTAINDRGEIAGFYFDVNFGTHGFVRDSQGVFTTTDDPNASSGTVFVALEQGINERGAVVGWYSSNGITYGFEREPEGTFLTIEPLASATSTLVGGINNAGAVTGYFSDANGYLSGYLRDADGSTTIFNVTGAEGAQGTAAFTMNASKAITGVAVDANGANHGFVRVANGRIFTFDAANPGPGNFQGTRPSTINNAGQVIGFVIDSSNVSHGFILFPASEESEEIGSVSRRP